jgi:hypothetical protein
MAPREITVALNWEAYMVMEDPQGVPYVCLVTSHFSFSFSSISLPCVATAAYSYVLPHPPTPPTYPYAPYISLNISTHSYTLPHPPTRAVQRRLVTLVTCQLLATQRINHQVLSSTQTMRALLLLLGCVAFLSTATVARVLPKVKRDNTSCGCYSLTNRGNTRFRYQHVIDFSTVCRDQDGLRFSFTDFSPDS